MYTHHPSNQARIPRMKAIIILPTENVLEEYRTYDSIFWFVKDGIRDVFRHIASNRVIDEDEIVREYVSEFEHYLDSLDRCNYILEGYIQDVQAIETVVRLLCDDFKMINRMLFRCDHHLYRHVHACWIGNDILLQIHE